MGQGRCGMTQGHRSHATDMQEGGALEGHHGHHGSGLVNARASTRVRFAAIRRLTGLFVPQRGGRVSSTQRGRGLPVVVAWHGRCSVRHRCDRNACRSMLSRVHLHHLHGRHGRGCPVEYQGNAQQQAQQDGAGGHGLTLTRERAQG